MPCAKLRILPASRLGSSAEPNTCAAFHSRAVTHRRTLPSFFSTSTAWMTTPLGMPLTNASRSKSTVATAFQSASRSRSPPVPQYRNRILPDRASRSSVAVLRFFPFFISPPERLLYNTRASGRLPRHGRRLYPAAYVPESHSRIVTGIGASLVGSGGNVEELLNGGAVARVKVVLPRTHRTAVRRVAASCTRRRQQEPGAVSEVVPAVVFPCRLVHRSRLLQRLPRFVPVKPEDEGVPPDRESAGRKALSQGFADHLHLVRLQPLDVHVLAPQPRAQQPAPPFLRDVVHSASSSLQKIQPLYHHSLSLECFKHTGTAGLPAISGVHSV